jgi:hypothetical protein
MSKELEIDKDEIDDAILALVRLNLHSDSGLPKDMARAGKSYDWNALNRLSEKGFIDDHVNTAKSVILTPEGLRRCEELFSKMFAKAK